ncbi:MAG: hypothetical protein AAGI15_07330 [Pseudomonadota bacterium]
MRLAAALCLLLLCAGELGLRLFEDRFSTNAAQIAAQLDALERSSDDTVVIGNSLSAHAFEHSEGLTLVTPDSSGLYEWYAITKHHDAAFDRFETVIITYAWNQLSDQHTILLDTIGGYLGTAGDVMDLGERKGLSFDARVDYLLGSVSKLWLYKTRIRRKLESVLLHRYESVTQSMNAAANERTQADQDARKRSYRTMADVLARLDHARITIVAMPLQTEYPVDPDLLTALQPLANVQFLDLRNYFRDRYADPEQFYIDHIHVNTEGAALLSTEILTRAGVQ